MTARPLLRWLGYTLSALGVILLGYCAYVLIEAKIFQARESERLERLIVHQPPPGPEAPVAPRPRPDPGSTLGKLEIDRLGVSAVVLEGTDGHSLKLGIGHLASSALLGETGNMVLAGHRDTFFRPLREIRIGDVVRLDTPDGTHRYVVESTTVVESDQAEVLGPTLAPTLTLVTCFPFYFVGHAPERFIVKAREVASTEIQQTTLQHEERPSPLPARRSKLAPRPK